MIMMKIQNILDILKNIAEEIEPVSNVRIAAAIVKHGTIISVGVNKKKTDPFVHKYNRDNKNKIYIHAELSAIKKAVNRIHDLSGCIIVVCRVNNRGEYRMCKPCKMCHAAIIEYGIRKIYYTDEKGNVVLCPRKS